MLPKITLSFLLLLAIAPPGASDPGDSVRQSLKERGEVYLSFPKPDIETLAQILDGVSLDRIDGDSVYVYANQRGYAWFRESGLPYSLPDPPGMVGFDLRMKGPEALKVAGPLSDWDFYPTYEAYVQIMAEFELAYPELCQVINIGKSAMDRDLLFARITAPGNGEERPVPRFMYTSTMHGDETAGFVLSLRLINYLLEQYGQDPGITRLLDETEIWICPNENPDGTYRFDNSTIHGATRGNINGVDLNRNYPNPVRDPLDAIQPETEVMMHFVDTMGFVLSANMHGGIELVNFPFDSWTSSQNLHADHDWWKFVMQEYVDTVHHYAPAGYMTGLGTGITHGGDWYVVYGSRQDYMNYYLSCREFTLELSNQKIPPPDQLPLLWENNYRSLINYIWQSTYGISGLVSKADDGKPLPAVVRLPGHDKDNSEVRTRPYNGFFQRPLQEGVFDVLLDAGENYPVMLFPGLAVSNYETVWLEVQMGLLDFQPMAITFEPAVAGGSSVEDLVVTNPGKEAIHVVSVTIDGDEVFAHGLPAKQSSFTILPGDSRVVPLIFYPDAPGEYQADLLLGLDVDPSAFIRIPLHGLALETATASPDLQVPVPAVVYPNPFHGRAMLRIDMPEAGGLVVEMFDMQGRRVKNIEMALPDAGVHELELAGPADRLPPGMYMLRVTTSMAVYRVSMLKIDHQ